MSEGQVLLNNTYINGGVTYIVKSEDDIINVNSSVGGATIIYLPNISSERNISRRIYIVDIGAMAATNNITLLTSGGDKINGESSLVLNTNKVSCEIICANDSEYLVNQSGDNPGASTVWGTITGDPTNQSDLQNGTIQGTFTPVASAVVTGDTFKNAFQKLQGSITAIGVGPFVKTDGSTPMVSDWNMGSINIGIGTGSLLDARLTIFSSANKGLKIRSVTIDRLNLYVDSVSEDVIFDTVNASMFFKRSGFDVFTFNATTTTFYQGIVAGASSNRGIKLDKGNQGDRMDIFVSDGSGGLTVDEGYISMNNSSLHIRGGTAFSKTWDFDMGGDFNVNGGDVKIVGNLTLSGATRNIGTSDSNVLQIQTNGTVRAVVAASGGWFGLGTGSPTAVLHSTYSALSSSAWTTSGAVLRFNAITLTDTSSSGTVAAQYVNVISAPTIAASSATTFTLSATMFIAGPVAGSGPVTQTNPAALVLGGSLYFNAGAGVAFGTYDSQTLSIRTNNTARIALSSTGVQTHNQSVASSGTTPFVTHTQADHTGGSAGGFLWTGGTLTGQTAATEVTDFRLATNASITWATGGIALQRTFVLLGRTYNFAASSTIVIASTMDVTQATVGSNCTITNNYTQRWLFDVNNYLGINISNIGLVTYTAVGTSNPGFVWNQFAVFNGSLTTATTTGNASVYFAAQASTTNNTTQAELNIAGAGTMYARWWNRGSVNYTPAANANYGSYVMGQQSVTIASSGTHALFAQAVFRPLSITAGAGTLTSSSTVYIEGAATGATNNYSLWVAAGPVKIDGVLSIGNTVNVVSPTSPNRTVTIVIGGTTYYLAAKTTND